MLCERTRHQEIAEVVAANTVNDPTVTLDDVLALVVQEMGGRGFNIG